MDCWPWSFWFGYKTIDKKLVTDSIEAETVRKLFSIYLEQGSVFELKQRLDELEWRTPLRVSRNGNKTGGKPYSRGQLYWILRNPIYIGKVRHRDEIWPGQHQAIIDETIWNAVQERLEAGSNIGLRTNESVNHQLLTGILYDETGDRLTPSHAGGKTRRYRYYVSLRLLQGSKTDQPGWRLPAPRLEKAVIDGIGAFLTDPVKLFEAIHAQDREADEINKAIEAATIKSEDIKHADKLARQIVHQITSRIEVSAQCMTIQVSCQGLATMLDISASQDSSDYHLEIPIAFRRRGIERKILIGEQASGETDQNLIKTIAQAHAWLSRLNSEKLTVFQLAVELKVDDGEISRVLPLAFLAPDIVRSIVQGRQPPELTTRRLKRLKPLPSLWHDQRKALNFPTQN